MARETESARGGHGDALPDQLLKSCRLIHEGAHLKLLLQFVRLLCDPGSLLRKRRLLPRSLCLREGTKRRGAWGTTQGVGRAGQTWGLLSRACGAVTIGVRVVATPTPRGLIEQLNVD